MGSSEIAGRGQLVLLAAGADAAHRLQGVGVVHQNLVLLRIDDVEQPVFGVDGESYRIDQTSLIWSTTSCLALKTSTRCSLPSETKMRSSSSIGDAVDQAEVASKPLRISVASLVSVLKMKIAPTFWSAT